MRVRPSSFTHDSTIHTLSPVPEFDYLLARTSAQTHFQHLCMATCCFELSHQKTVEVTFTDSEAALYGCMDSLGLMQSSADLSINTSTTVTHMQFPPFHNPRVLSSMEWTYIYDTVILR